MGLLLYAVVSFISLKHVFCAISKIVSEETIMIFLIKPQFELSKEILDKTKGKITFDKHHQLAINNVLNDAKSFHFSLMTMTESPIKGKKMCNTEYFSVSVFQRFEMTAMQQMIALVLLRFVPSARLCRY